MKALNRPHPFAVRYPQRRFCELSNYRVTTGGVVTKDHHLIQPHTHKVTEQELLPS